MKKRLEALKLYNFFKFVYNSAPMVVTVLNCGLSSVTNSCISGQLVYQVPLCHIVFERSTNEGWRNLSGTSSDSWGLFIGTRCLSVGYSKTRKTLLTINNFLLKHNGATIRYTIYIHGNCVIFCCIWEADKWGIWLVQSFYVTQFFGEWGFWWRGFQSWKDFFSYSPVFSMDIRHLLSFDPKSIYFHRGFSCVSLIVSAMCSQPLVDQSGQFICISHLLCRDPFACLVQLWPTVLLIGRPQLIVFHSFTSWNPTFPIG